MDQRKILGFAGSILLFLGVFAPLISFPIAGTLNYFQNGRGDGIVILALAAMSAIFTILEKYKFLFPTASGCFAVLTFTFMTIQSRLSEMKSRLEVTDSAFRGLAELGITLIQIQWGFAVLVLGACFVLAAVAVDDSLQKRSA